MYTLPETHMFAPYNGRLEDEFPFGVSQVQTTSLTPMGLFDFGPKIVIYV